MSITFLTNQDKALIDAEITQLSEQRVSINTELTTWYQGAINLSTGAVNKLETRVRCPYTFIESNNVILSFPDDKETIVCIYGNKSSASYERTYSSWTTSPVSLNDLKGKYIIVILRNPDDSIIVPEDISGVTLSFAINTDKTLSLEEKAADAKETGDSIRAITSALRKTFNLKNYYVRDGNYIALNTGLDNIVDMTPVNASGYAHITYPVRRGDTLTLYGAGGSASRLWGLTNSEYVLTSVANANLSITSDNIITINVTEDGYFISNVNTNSTVGFGLNITKIPEIETYEDHLNNVATNMAEIDRFIYSNDIREPFLLDIANLPAHPWDENNGAHSPITVEEMYTQFDALIEKYNGDLTTEVIGTGSDGQDIKVYKLTPSHCPTSYTPYRPTIMVTCATHGWEKAGTETILLLLTLMCDHWDLHPLLETLRFDVNWIIVPIVNTYGFSVNSRQNANGVDLNRNYPVGWKYRTEPESSTYQGTSALSEPESRAVYALMESNTIDIGIDFHDFGDSSSDRITWVVTQSGKALTVHLGQVYANKLSRLLVNQFDFLNDVDTNTLGSVTAYSASGKTKNAFYATGAKLAYTFEMCGVLPRETDGKRFNDNHALICIEAFANFVARNLLELEKVAYTTTYKLITEEDKEVD